MNNKVRFVGDVLKYDKGDVVPFTYEDLCKACLENSFKQISIIEIVVEAIRDLTGCELIRYRCRESNLFNDLERVIQQDERYKARKAEVLLKTKEFNEKSAEGRRLYNARTERHYNTSVHQMRRIREYYKHKN